MKQLNWKNAIYYGEVFGFVFAWAIGMVVALSSSPSEKPSPGAENVAVRSGGFSLD